MPANVLFRFSFLNLCSETKSINFNFAFGMCNVSRCNVVATVVENRQMDMVRHLSSHFTHKIHKDKRFQFNQCNRLSTSSTNHLLFSFYHLFYVASSVTEKSSENNTKAKKYQACVFCSVASQCNFSFWNLRYVHLMILRHTETI